MYLQSDFAGRPTSNKNWGFASRLTLFHKKNWSRKKGSGQKCEKCAVKKCSPLDKTLKIFHITIMRLDKEQKAALEKAVENVNGEVYLFGSRVDDNKRGGDIDILIFSEKDAYKLSRQVSVKFFMECEEKIDVTVMNPNKLTREQEAFLKVIKMERIK